MITPETAKKLKKAGLIWEPRTGDVFVPEDFPDGVFVNSGDRIPEPGDVWLPDVEEMVNRITGLGWDMNISFRNGKCRIGLRKNGKTARFAGRAEDFADLVGKALLYALKEEK
jgi:hypothetical protein